MSTAPDAKAPVGLAKSTYEAGHQERNIYLQRGRDCAKLTIPALLPEEGFNYASELPTPYQSLGARGVRNLASKLLIALYPTNTPFFQYKVDDKTLEELGAKRGEVEKALASRERATGTEVDKAVFRPAAFSALMHLIVTGNACVYLPTDSKERAVVYRLDQYVTKRDRAGNLTEAVIHERMDIGALDAATRAKVMELEEFKSRDKAKYKDSEVDVFTHITLEEDGKWKVCQEVCGMELPGSGTYPKDELPYFFLRFSFQPGENYGRGYVEEFLGDLDSLEALSEALVEGSAASARIVFLVDPAGSTSLSVVANARTGDTVSGRAGDVQAMQVQKSTDLQVAKSQAEEIAARISYAFLLHSSVQRSGERVTAQEIRYMASELDDGLGGVYTLLAADFQMPTVRIFEKRMEKRLKVDKLPDNVNPILVSGLQAIGRGQDQRNLQAFAAEIIQVLTPQVAMKYLNFDEYLNRAAAGYSIDPNGLVKTADQIAAEEQKQQAMMAMQQLGPQAINQMGGVAKEAAKQGQQ